MRDMDVVVRVCAPHVQGIVCALRALHAKLG